MKRFFATVIAALLAAGVCGAGAAAANEAATVRPETAGNGAIGHESEAEEPLRLLPFSAGAELCSVSIPNILQDSKGFMWFGTPDGIDRYDGYEVRHIRIPDDCGGYGNVRTMCEDDAGNIWFGSFKGICIWEAATQTVRKYSEGAVVRIIKSRDGALWVAANYGGFLRIDPASGACDTLSFAYHNASAHYGEDICYDGGDTVWFLNGVGAIYRCGLADRELELVVSHEESLLRTGTRSVTRFQYIDGYLCGGQRNHNSYFYDISSGTFTIRPWGMLAAGGNTSSGGSYLISDEGLMFFPEGLRAGLESGSKPLILCGTNQPVSAIQDRDGSFWIGTAKDGVLRLIPNRAGFRRIGEQKGPYSVNSLAVTPDGALWIGTAGNGLLRYSPQDDMLREVPLPGGVKRISGLGTLDGNLAVGTSLPEMPLLTLDPGSYRATVHRGFQSDLSVFLGTGNGTALAGGWLLSLDLGKGIEERIERVRTGTTDLKKDKYGRIWAATSFSGIWKVENGSWTHYTDSNSVVMRTNSIYPDGKGNIWICSPDDGLQRFNPESGETELFSVFGGVSCPRINGITADPEGTLWLATPKGLATLNPENGQTALYSPWDGLGAGESGFTKILSLGGRIYAADSDGLICFNPLLMKEVRERPGRIVFTSFSFLGPLEKEKSATEKQGIPDIDGKSRIKLRSRENSFTIGVSQMDYGSPRSTKLDFRLEGYDKRWIPIDRGAITVTNLPPGQYRLSIRQTGRDGSTLVNTRSLDIKVARPLLGSIPAILLYIIVLAGGIYFVFRNTRRQTLRKAEEASRIENERKEAESQKQLYASKVEFLTTIAHEIRTPLTLVKGPVETLQQRLARYADKSVVEDLAVVSHNADKLSDLLDELLDFQKLENSGIKLSPAEYEIDAIVKAAFGRFTLAARRKNMEFSLSLPDGPVTASVDKNALDKIVSNLLSNAVKYGSCTVRVQLTSTPGEFRLTTENDGSVVPLEERERIFRPFERFVRPDSIQPGTGIGLHVARNLAVLHGGTLAMDGDTSINRFILAIPIVHIAEEAKGLPSLPEVIMPRLQPTVLIVEDSEDMLEFISRQFEPRYSVLTARNGAEALTLLKDNPFSIPDCIISDVMMPEMDGYELCRKVKGDSRTSHIPVILLTARADTDSRLLGLEEGADAYLSKPFSVNELLTLVASQIRNRERLKEKFASLPVTGHEDMKNSSPDAQLLLTVDKYVNEHIADENLSVESLAAEACISTSKLFKKMKQLVGMGPNEYILNVRLRKSQKLLLSTSLPIAEVAASTGFRSPSYFSSCFKAQFGLTPKEFRAGKE